MKDKINKKPVKDRRITTNRIPWQEYLAILIIMLCLTGGQALIFYSYVDISNTVIPISFIFANIGYWALMTLCICVVTAIMRRRTYVKPMRMLSEAAKQVAEGDFSVYLTPLRKDGKRDYMEVMFEDFNVMVEELGSIETLKNDFIANVSHEIKTPLSIIQSYATALEKNDLSPTLRKEYTETIIMASKNLSTLVTNILKLNKLENQEIKTSTESYDICRQLSDCVLLFEHELDAKNIEFVANMDDKAIIEADSSMLEIIWYNLLSNAIKFTEPGGNIMLTQTSDENNITVSITDTGSGMDENTMDRIFDKFYQGDTSHSGAGNGLGLALVKRVIDLIEGTITVNSETNVGSTFTVNLKI